MAAYRVRVRTGTAPAAGTSDAIAVTLVGTRGSSPRTVLDRWGPDFHCGAVHKGPCRGLPESSWYLESVTVWGQRGDSAGDSAGDDSDDSGDSAGDNDPDDVTHLGPFHFPCYRWLEGYGTWELPEGTANVPPLSPEYVVQHWQEDAFFGEQFLSGVNPVLLRRCPRLPPKFPVTPPMVAPSLGPGTSLQREMESDIDIFGVSPQLSQEPGPDSPIFLPGDPPWLWALAKAWVRSADFHVHEGLTHLLRAHLLGEVFALATLRQLAPQHPLFKAVALGRRGLLALVARGLRALRWRSLVLPRDLRHRGVAATKRHHFGNDATKVWGAIRRYVSGVLALYYPSDVAVQEDPELQAWVWEIFKRGFLGRQRSGVPSHLDSVRGLVTFVTTVIYTCSAHHAATNSGQRPLGHFPELHFTEPGPRLLIRRFRRRLRRISRGIRARNAALERPYPYLDPENIENSVAI
ncbi:PREDICTED: arachidonate 15-lipoxygenase B-like [Sturnus vulgaris]|uniref:arachidonate 15-lipoxygenase B-like n=1 Tax=Sturnus vulgaris TaxID=9172 RepID=UPI00071A1726|nr:PREDICTED: arachidonate 15-lipoxygenase B-like [Sturnus vulgaris]